MATKIFTAPKTVQVENEVTNSISQEVITIQDGFSSEAIKQTIHLQYGVDGSCSILNENYNKNYIDLGSKNEHRVTWLILDVDNLIWNSRHIAFSHSIPKEEQYKLYDFKLIFKIKDKIYSFYIDTTRLYKGDLVFEVPRILTQEAGTNYEMILVIEESFNDEYNYKNNIPDSAGELTTQDLDDDGTLDTENTNVNNKNVSITYAEAIMTANSKQIKERFVSKTIKAAVSESIYNGEALEVDNILNSTNQLDSLVKEALWGTLDNDGNLKFERYDGRDYVIETSLGQELDSYVKYIKFAPEDLNQHIVNLKPYLFFRHKTNSGYEICYSPFEAVDDEHAAYYDSEDYQYVIWIPARVYEFPGQWEIAVVAFAGNVPVKPTFSEWTKEQLEYSFERDMNDQYYCYISKSIIMTVEDNFLTKEQFEELQAWNGGYVLNTDEGAATMSLTKEYINYNADASTLMLDDAYLSATNNELLVQTRNLDYVETKISYINGCEIVDKASRAAIEGLQTTGVVGMGQAEFNGNLNENNELVFNYTSPLDLATGRMYAFNLITDVDFSDNTNVKFLFNGNELILATPSTESTTVKTLNQHFIQWTGNNCYEWYFSGYLINRNGQLVIISTADNVAEVNVDEIEGLTERIDELSNKIDDELATVDEKIADAISDVDSKIAASVSNVDKKIEDALIQPNENIQSLSNKITALENQTGPYDEKIVALEAVTAEHTTQIKSLMDSGGDYTQLAEDVSNLKSIVESDTTGINALNNKMTVVQEQLADYDWIGFSVHITEVDNV